MPLLQSEIHVAIDAVTARSGFMSLHTADPGGTGVAEASGGAPAYARKALVWPAASAGQSQAAQVTFDVPAGTYAQAGFWSAATAGAFRGSAVLSASETFGGQGQLKVTVTVTG